MTGFRHQNRRHLLSGHPLNAFKPEVRRFVRRTLAQLEPSRNLTMLAGVVMEQRTKVGNRGKMAFVQIDDGTEPREVTVYSEVLDASRGKIVTDEVVVIEAKVSNATTSRAGYASSPTVY